MTKMLLLLALLFAPSLRAESLKKPLSPCTVALQQVVQSRLEMLTPEERIQIENVFAASQASGEKSPTEQAFEIIFTARQRGLSQKEIDTLLDVLKRVEKRPGSDFGGYYSKSGKVSLTFPQDYFGSILEWGILLHELEHVAQKGALKEKVTDIKTFLVRRSDIVDFIFASEEGAMSAEWEFFHNIPESLRGELADKIKADKSLPESAKKFVLRMLINSSHDRETYLRLEREAGRYSRRAIHFRFVTVPIIGKTIAIGSVASSYALLAQMMYCFTGIVFDRPDSDSIQVLQKVCRMIGLGKVRTRATQFRGDGVRPLQDER